ncbi:hypothetical protein [Streptomyces sp. TP-A0356]|uniref:hypothetical protein n=1 Tax=Streptomyces sp. TP-A0356 TaxID=1359208 RepID=UPI000AE583F0|nr:hypothetical protein [Streptomyces sp. TP-A0356]
MTKRRPQRGVRADPGALLANEVEGYLLAHAQYDSAHREAAALCARLPWLTGAQAEDITRHYVEQRLDLVRHLLRSTAERADQLRCEYETRYAGLRRTLLKLHAVLASALLVGVVGIGAVMCTLAR